MDFLIAAAVRHRVLVVLLAAVWLAGGVLVAARTPLDVFPEFVPPQVTIQTEAPGWSAAKVEQFVTSPIEQSLAGALGVATMRSDSIAGLSVVSLGFADDADPDRARIGIAERLAEATARLPGGIGVPRMSPLTSSTMDVLKFGLQSSTLDRFQLRDLAEWTLKPRLLAVPGVARVTVFGGAVRQWQLRLDPDRIEASGLTVQALVEATRAALGVQAVGTLELASQQLPVVVREDRPGAAQLGDLVLRLDRNGPLRLRDVAEIVPGEPAPIGDALIQGRPGVLLTVSGQLGSNTLAVTHALEATLTTLAPQLAAQGATLVSPLHRPANFIERALRELGFALATGSLLILATLYLFLGNWRTVAISFATIPLSLLAAVMVLHACGETVNTLTLGGFAVALGVLVDDAIVDIENVVRRLRLNAASGSPRALPAVVRDASQEIRSPVLHATLVVVLVFLPVLALSGVQGRLLTPMAFAFIASVLASLLVALTATPALCALLLDAPEAERDPRWWQALSRFHRIGQEWVARHLRLVLVALVLSLAVALAALPHLRGEFFPMFREGHFVLQVSARQPGMPIPAMRQVGASISAEILKLPHVASVEQQIGRAEQGEDTWGTHRSEFHVALDPRSDVDQVAMQRQLRRVLARYPDLQSEVMTFLGDRISETLTGETSAVVVEVSGSDLDALERTGGEIASLARGVAGVVDLRVTSSAPSASLGIELGPTAGAQGIGGADLAQAVSTALSGIVVGQMDAAGHPADVVVTWPPAMRANIGQLTRIPLATRDGRLLRVRDVARIGISHDRPLLQHAAGQRRVAVSFNVAGRAAAEVVADLQRRIAAAVVLPAGVFVELGGVAEAERTARRELLLHATLAAALIALCLGLAFRRASEVGLVLLNLPFALIGSIAAIAASGIGLSLGTMVGLVTVFGISARNAILLLAHYAHLQHAEHQPWSAALVARGAGERLRPVLMTAAVTALGLIPLALGLGRPGHEIEAPMAITVLGGLLTSTLLTLFVLPCLAQPAATVQRRPRPTAVSAD